MPRRPETFCEIRRRVLGRRIIQLRYANTLSFGDIRRVMIQVDSGEWLEVSGMPGLTIELVPLLHPDAAKLCVGGNGETPTLEPPKHSPISERVLKAFADFKREFEMAAQAPTRPPWPGVDKRVCKARKKLFDLLEEHYESEVEWFLKWREKNKALSDRLAAMQEAVDSAYSLLRERHDPCWLMDRAERILNPHRTK